MEEQLKMKQDEVYERDRSIQDKDTEIVLSKNDAERAKSLANERQTTLDAYRMQLDEIYLKNKSLLDSNSKYQKTLKETQDELERLVKQYETLSQALSDSDHQLQKARKFNYELKRDLEDRNL